MDREHAQTYATGVVDQVQAAASRRDKAELQRIVNRVRAEQGADAATMLTAVIMLHALRGAAALESQGEPA